MAWSLPGPVRPDQATVPCKSMAWSLPGPVHPDQATVPCKSMAWSLPGALPPDEASPSDCDEEGGAQVLVTQRPEATTALLMQLCTRQAPGAPEGVYVTRIADVSHLYADRCVLAKFFRGPFPRDAELEFLLHGM
jgi:hypothetical protein